MTFRRLVPLVLAISATAAGCGAPQAEYSFNEQGENLVPKAKKAVQQTTVDGFGTPHNLVAQMALPIDFGRIRLRVTESGPQPHQFFVELDEPEEKKEGTDSTVESAAAGPPGGGIGVESFRTELNLQSPPETIEDALALGPRGFVGLGAVFTSGPFAKGAYFEQRGQPLEASFHVTGFDAGQSLLALNYKLDPQPQPGETLELIGHRLQHGRKLYMQHCMHCHGVSGDGNGPTAEYLNPRPRDYRKGLFKFKSTREKSTRPRREDLVRIVRRGIPGTYMPSFLLLEDDELYAIIEYVRFLSMRGEYELKLIVEFEAEGFSQERFEERKANAAEAYQKALEGWKQAGAPEQYKPTREQFDPEQGLENYLENELAAVSRRALQDVAGAWREVETNPDMIVVPKTPRPAPTGESIARGRELFLSGVTKCVECHGVSGRGDGSQTRTYMTSAPAFPGGVPPEPGLYDEWGHKLHPRDLTRGIYRGGRRPIDLFRRVSIGIPGTPMPQFGTALSDEEIWHLVNYVLSIPYDGAEAPPIVETAKRVAARR